VIARQIASNGQGYVMDEIIKATNGKLKG